MAEVALQPRGQGQVAASKFLGDLVPTLTLLTAILKGDTCKDEKVAKSYVSEARAAMKQLKTLNDEFSEYLIAGEIPENKLEEACTQLQDAKDKHDRLQQAVNLAKA